MTINIFSVGDANNINTWSNLPYFFTKAFRDEGVNINLLNIEPDQRLKRVYKYSIGIVLNVFMRVTGNNFRFVYYRSSINNYITNRNIKNFCKKHPEADCNIFLTFSFSSWKYSDIPVIHYCDQIYEEVLINRNLIPNVFEKKIIKREINILRNASYVYSTGLNTIKLIQSKYLLNNSMELGYRINLDIENISIDHKEIFELKKQSRIILFIGKSFHERGVDILLEAFKIFNSRMKYQYQLHIVGPVAKEIKKNCYPNLVLYNYLNKGIESEYNTYLDLLKKARMQVYPIRFGPIPGSSFEGNLFFTPSVITNIHELDKEIRNYENGILINDLDPQSFANAMYELATDNDLWYKLALNAHESVKKFTLKAMAQSIIRQIHSFTN
jgi:glycosyltransferase involved in cell wall biosynthesis